VVFAVRPVTGADTATALVPLTRRSEEQETGADLYSVVVPYSNLHSVTSPPLGLTVAFSVAVVWVTALAFSLTTVGGLGSV
jgi:hypothetical protein